MPILFRFHSGILCRAQLKVNHLVKLIQYGTVLCKHPSSRSYLAFQLKVSILSPHCNVVWLWHDTQEFQVLYFSFVFNLFFDWRIIALQNFVAVHQTSPWISHRYTCILSLFYLPPIPDSSVGEESACNAGDPGLIPGSRRSPLRRKWQTTPAFLPGKSHGQRSLEVYSPCGHKESDTTQETQHSTAHVW